MKQETFDKLIRRSYDLLDMIPHEKNRHFSFILKKNKIVSFGWNQIKKTNTLCWKHKYEYPYIHSEISAIRNFEYPASLFSRCELVNVRVGKNNDISLVYFPVKQTTQNDNQAIKIVHLSADKDIMKQLALKDIRDEVFKNEDIAPRQSKEKAIKMNT